MPLTQGISEGKPRDTYVTWWLRPGEVPLQGWLCKYSCLSPAAGGGGSFPSCLSFLSKVPSIQPNIEEWSHESHSEWKCLPWNTSIFVGEPLLCFQGEPFAGSGGPVVVAGLQGEG